MISFFCGNIVSQVDKNTIILYLYIYVNIDIYYPYIYIAYIFI